MTLISKSGYCPICEKFGHIQNVKKKEIKNNSFFVDFQCSKCKGVYRGEYYRPCKNILYKSGVVIL